MNNSPATLSAGSSESLEKTVTTKELAETLGVSVRTIQQTVEKLKLTNVLSQVKIRGQNAFIYNEEQATLIKQEIQKHHNLASRHVDNVSTDLEILNNAASAFTALKDLYNRKEAEYQATIKYQEQQLIEQQPKVEYVDSYCDSTNLEEIGHLGKVTKIGEIKIFKTLVNDGYIKVRYSTDGIKSYDPCFGYEKYFETIHVPFIQGDKQYSRDKLMLNHKGFMYFRAKYASGRDFEETAENIIEEKKSYSFADIAKECNEDEIIIRNYCVLNGMIGSDGKPTETAGIAELFADENGTRFSKFGRTCVVNNFLRMKKAEEQAKSNKYIGKAE